MIPEISCNLQVMSVRRVIGYVRVSTGERRSSRPSRTDQRRLLAEACEARGWQLVRVEEDLRTGRSLRRPGLQAALSACRRGVADAVVVARLDRLTTVLDDLSTVIDQLGTAGAAIVSLDLDLDTATEAGALAGRLVSTVAAWHGIGTARLGGRAQPRQTPPALRGRPSSTPTELADRIRAMREAGLTLQAICDTLNAERVPTPRGGTLWRPTSLRSILKPARQTGRSAGASESREAASTRTDTADEPAADDVHA